MKAQILTGIHDLRQETRPLEAADVQDPKPGANQVLIRVHTCGVCHTELDEIEGRTPPPEFPMILGHQVVGTVIEKGEETSIHKIGERVGVGWIYASCGNCEFCRKGLENLCSDFQATGRDKNGGYAELMVVPEMSAIPIPEGISDTEAAPLLCAGAIGYRSLRLTELENGQPLGLMGFGASAHLVLKMVRHTLPDSPVFVFARNPKEQEFSKETGAVWAGDIDTLPPEPLNGIIDTTPVWKPVIESMRFLKPAGRLVINAIRKEDHDKERLTGLDYVEHLWMEKEIKSVANVCRSDIKEFLDLAAKIPLKPEVQTFPLEEANKALLELKTSKIRGAKVLRISGSG